MTQDREIMLANKSDIADCLRIERSVSETEPGALRGGFLLSSSQSEEAFQEGLQSKAFWICRDNKKIIAFLFALAPNNPTVSRLQDRATEFELHPDHTNPFHNQNVAWLGKVAVDKSFQHQGIASLLYKTLFQSFPNWNVLTTTVKSPMENIPSRQFHTKQDFIEIGEWNIGNRGTLIDVRCRLHFKQTNSAQNL